jgi:hypothetical protein
MRFAKIAAALACVCLIAGPAGAQLGARCMVSDPTGTPLNIRDSPRGRIVGTIRNGVFVRLAGTAFDERGRPWAYIVRWDSGQGIGWVFREFISCY